MFNFSISSFSLLGSLWKFGHIYRTDTWKPVLVAFRFNTHLYAFPIAQAFQQQGAQWEALVRSRVVSNWDYVKAAVLTLDHPDQEPDQGTTDSSQHLSSNTFLCKLGCKVSMKRSSPAFWYSEGISGSKTDSNADVTQPKPLLHFKWILTLPQQGLSVHKKHQLQRVPAQAIFAVCFSREVLAAFLLLAWRHMTFGSYA